jgi:hypothetical protein
MIFTILDLQSENHFVYNQAMAVAGTYSGGPRSDKE